MKKIILLAFILITVTTQAQLKETSEFTKTTSESTIGGFTASMEMSQATLSSSDLNGIIAYTLKFRLSSKNDSKWTTIIFTETGGTLNSFYDILNSFFSKENKKNDNYKRTFKLGNEEVICTNHRSITTSIYFKTNDGDFYITEKQLNKLFGKEKKQS